MASKVASKVASKEEEATLEAIKSYNLLARKGYNN
jgi:hypothetical protein